MKYRALAQVYLFKKGADATPTPEDAKWLTDGEKDKFATKQFDKFTTALNEVADKARQRLIDRGWMTED